MPNHVNLDPYRQNFRFCKKNMLSFFWGVCRKRQTINFIDTIPLLINTIAPKSMESPGYLKATWVSV